jgi:hypothetical protein
VRGRGGKKKNNETCVYGRQRTDDVFVFLITPLVTTTSQMRHNAETRKSVHQISQSVPSLLAQSSHPPATNMAPLTKYSCPCFKCNSRKKLVKRTILTHFKENQEHLGLLRTSGAHLDAVDFVQHCHDEIIQLLDSLNESPSLRRSESPSSDGECLFFYVFNYLLIYLDLADPVIASPPFSEGALVDEDNMMVDDDCE